MLLFLSENTHLAAEEIYIFSVTEEAEMGQSVSETNLVVLWPTIAIL